MRIHARIILVATYVVCGVVFGDEVSNTYTYKLDTEDWPRTFKTDEEIAALDSAVRKVGEIITLTSSKGEDEIIVPANSNVQSIDIVVDRGGKWTLSNSRQGSVVYTIRHSRSNTVGDGTLDSPAKIVDGDELIDYSVGDGYVFKLEGLESLFKELKLPENVRLELVDSENDTWRLVSDNNGVLHKWGEIVYPLDSLKNGPNRSIGTQCTWPIAYSGDDWIGAINSAATLTLVPPEGSGASSTTLDLKGTGTTSFLFTKTGVWTVELRMANGKTVQSSILVVGGMRIILK